VDPLKLTGKAEGEGYTKLRDALATVESSNRPGAINEFTKASGLYQFIPRWWDKFAKKETGRDIASFMPKDKSQAELERAGNEQKNILFPKYYEKELAPFVAATRKRGLAKNLSDIQVATAFHKLGAGDATKYFKTGFDASRGTKGNEAIADYIAKVDKNIDKPPTGYKTEPSYNRIASTNTSQPSSSGSPSSSLAAPADAMEESNRDIMKRLMRLAGELRDRIS
jgi:hypothetical protein